PFTAMSSSLRPGPTSPSTSQRAHSACASCCSVSRNNDRPVKQPDNGRLSGTTAVTRQRSRGRRPAAVCATRARYPVHLLRRSKMTGKIMPLREQDTSTIQAAADAFLSSPRYANPNTRRSYAGVLDRLLAQLGASRPLAEVSGEELASLLEQLWGQRAPATWNRNRGAITAWLSWCAASRHHPDRPDARTSPGRRP